MLATHGKAPKSVLLVVGFCLVLLSACVPIAGTYYSPMMQNGTTYRQDCQSGAPSGIKIARGGALLLISSSYEPSDKTTLAITIQFGLSKTVHAQVRWNTVKAYDEQTPNIPIESVSNHGYNIPATRNSVISLPIVDQEEMVGEKFGFYERTLDINTPLPDEFTFVLPAMVIDGVAYPATEIKFKKGSGMWLIPVNC